MPALRTLQPHGPLFNTQRVHNLTVANNVRTNGRAWRKLRRRVLVDARWVCQCTTCRAESRVRPAHEVDHIIPLADGGTDARSNLQAINRECHAIKSAAEATRRGQGTRGTGGV